MAINSGNVQTRAKGWMLTSMSNLASILPDNPGGGLYAWPEKQYWLDVIAGNFTMSVACIAANAGASNSNFSDAGHWICN